MRYIIEFTGEHPSLPATELKSVVSVTGENLKFLTFDGRMAIVESDGLIQSVERSALCRSLSMECASPLLGEHNEDDLVQRSAEIDAMISSQIPKAQSYRITTKKLGGRHPEIQIEKMIQCLAKEISLPVSLHKPGMEITVFMTPNLYFGIVVHVNDRTVFHKRKVRYRPFFSPISLDPILARALVNLSCVPRKGIILDPFCGTGGILLEALLLGYHPIGTDRDVEMLSGAKMNLNHFQKDARDFTLIHSDIGDLVTSLKEKGIDQVDGIATDMPYARASTTFGEDLQTLTNRAMRSYETILKPGGCAAIVLSEVEAIQTYYGALKLVSCHKLKVHRSLTRYFLVLKKPS